jgi:hypothetical protein
VKATLDREQLGILLMLAAELAIEAGTDAEIALVKGLCAEHEIDPGLIGWEPPAKTRLWRRRDHPDAFSAAWEAEDGS